MTEIKYISVEQGTKMCLNEANLYMVIIYSSAQPNVPTRRIVAVY